jgi:hypothetical protein
MKKKTKSARTKVKPETLAKNMKKQLGEFHALRVVRGLVNSNKNFNAADINLKDVFDLKELNRNHRLWEQVYNILHNQVK